MEEITNLLSQLAEKLGTTTEYLWDVLVKQAPIDSITILIQMILVVIYGIVLWKIHVWLTKIPEGGSYSRYEDKEELVQSPMIIASIIFVTLVIVCFFYIGDVVNGFINPEYWALDNILGRFDS